MFFAIEALDLVLLLVFTLYETDVHDLLVASVVVFNIYETDVFCSLLLS